MITNVIYSLATVAGAMGLWLIVTSALGSWEGLFRSLRKSPLQGIEGDASTAAEHFSWPLSARIARSFSRRAAPKTGDDDLMVRLFQAGLPYYSPAHYYSRQVASALLFAAFALVNTAALAQVFHLPAVMILAVTFLLGLWGAAQPAAEVRSKTKRRAKDLVLDMTYQLPRLILLLEAYGSAQEAIREYLATAARMEKPEKEREEARRQAQTLSKEFALELGTALAGMGGNLFAELLNRIAGELTRGVRPEAIAIHLRQVFPPGIELDHFLQILIGGMEGNLPMKERLAELSHQLRVDLRARQREAAQAANQVVIVAAAAELLPIFAVVGAPVVFLAFRMFQ